VKPGPPSRAAHGARHGCGLSRDVTTKSVRSLPHCEQRWGDFELSTRREKTVQPRHRFGGGDSHDQAAPVTKAQSEGHPAAIAIAGVAALRDQIAAAEGQAEATKEASPEDGSIGVNTWPTPPPKLVC
jgi:hypothetical protein